MKVYRRRAATLVAEVGGRGGAGPKNTRNRAKAEVFEDVLCRVSQRLADAARASAEALRAERLAEGRQTPDTALATAGTSITPPGLVSASRPLDRRPDFTGLHKGHASTRATGARRQARRDGR